MADKKISALTSLAQGDVAASTDVLPIVDTSATETKKVTAAALVGAGLTAGVTNVDINSGSIDGTTIGANSAAAGTFTNLTASGTVSFSGATVSNGGSVTTVDINGGTIDGASIGASSASTGSFTTLTTSSTVTLNGGTANGVLYLNGSKVATSGSALWFDGTNFGVGTGGNSLNHQSVIYKGGANAVYQQVANGSTGLASTNGVRLGVSSGGSGELYAPTALISYIDNSEGMRLTSTGLGIGTSSPSVKLQVKSSAEAFRIEGTTARGGGNIFASFHDPSGRKGYWGYGDSADNYYISNELNTPMLFLTNAVERARITAGGDLLVKKTTADATSEGIAIQSNGRGIFTSNSATECLLLNRQDSDGTLVDFRQANTTEGSISVSGNTVSYNAFAGSHWSQLQDGSKPDILRGTVMESINELCVWPGENNERLPKAKISDTAGSKKVYGVFMAWDNDWTTTNDMYVTAVGAFICRVNGSVIVQEGDLLESNGDGTARVQADDIIRSSTIGKVTSTVKTHQYGDGSYCVPTVLYCG